MKKIFLMLFLMPMLLQAQTRFYFYFNLETCELEKVSTVPEIILDTFLIDIDLNVDENGSPIIPVNWQENETILRKILRFKQAALIEKTRYILTLEDVITAQEMLDWKVYWAALYNLSVTADLTGITLETLNTVFPTMPTAGIIAQLD
jgi:hypothetical protein